MATSNFLNRGKSFICIRCFGTRTRTAGVKGTGRRLWLRCRLPERPGVGRLPRMTIGENYNPRLGSSPAPASASVPAGWSSPPGRILAAPAGDVRGLTIQDYFNLAHHGSETTRIQVTPLELQFNSGDRVAYVAPNLEQLVRALRDPRWRLRSGRKILDGHTSRGMPSPRCSRPFSAISTSRWLRSTGTRRQAGGELTWRKSSHLSTSIKVEQNWVRLKEGNFKARLFGYRFDYSFTPLISLSSLVQYDSDSAEHRASEPPALDTKPGNEFFIVINHAWQEDTFDRFVDYQTRARVKLNYTFRF